MQADLEDQRTATDEAMSTQVLAVKNTSPTKRTQPLSVQMGFGQSSIKCILRANKWYPYTLQMLQHLIEGNPDCRVEFCEWTFNMHDNVSGQNWLERLSLCIYRESEIYSVEHIS
ncbi:hypothetical protein AVEN_68173-1 [Araneus ventricosus]|uniref:Uncharacterized protein n=1 Tax=Araneus ventricosus TaxID=182803 RepID=A0A4Y2CCD5_ARAVE|nr:hypothetical protein AVEN_68173-1 [Araneus ventricosus]